MFFSQGEMFAGQEQRELHTYAEKFRVASITKMKQTYLYTTDKNCAIHTLCSIKTYTPIYKFTKMLYNT